MIQIRGLKKKYGASTIFENAAFSFPDRGLVCVLGPSGCGKSTLLNLLAGFDSEYEGEITVHGSSLTQMNAEELCAYRRDNIGFIFQNYHLLSGYSVLENVLLASEAVGESLKESEPKAKELLAKIGLSEKINQTVETLSGGQKQRVAIARALLNSPSVILADEPTGALDRKNSSEIMELLKTMAKNRLVIVITHDKKCAEYAEQVVTIEDGKLVCQEQAADSRESEAVRLKKRDTPHLSLWGRALKNFRVHLARYIAIALAVSLGVLCFSLSLSSGNIMEQAIADFEAKNTAFHNGHIKADENEEELLAQLQADERIENVYAQYVLHDMTVSVGGKPVDIAEKYPMARAAENLSYGVMPRRGTNEIALNPSLAAKFAKNIQDLIGQTAELTFGGQTVTLTISGIFNAIYDDFYVSSDIEQQMYEGVSGKVYSVSYDVKAFEDIVPVSEELAAKGIVSTNASAQVAAFLQTFRNVNRLFLTVSILIFAIGIFISAILLVKQQNTRFREVGLLSALGYTKNQISKILFYENLALSALAGVCTVLLTVIALLVSSVIGFSLVFTVSQTLVTLCLTAVLILIISMLSGIRLVNTEPAAALRK